VCLLSDWELYLSFITVVAFIGRRVAEYYRTCASDVIYSISVLLASLHSLVKFLYESLVMLPMIIMSE